MGAILAFCGLRGDDCESLPGVYFDRPAEGQCRIRGKSLAKDWPSRRGLVTMAIGIAMNLRVDFYL